MTKKNRTSALQSAKKTLRVWFPHGASVLAAVSGGVDSMCLLHLLTDWGAEWGFRVTAAHFNHRLRGAAASRDEQFVREYCREHGVPFLSGSGDTRALAANGGESLEEAGRTLRYAFLRSAAKQAGCPWILTAHHADDNAETMLMNLIRGTGSAGLGGIPARRDGICRPFLNVTRGELLEYAAENKIPHMEDETNEADEASRNVIRHRILPVLRELNPRAVENMARTAGILGEENRLLETLAERAVAAADQMENGSVRIPCRTLAQIPDSLAGRAALHLMECVCGRRKDLTEKHAAAVIALASGGKDGQISLPYGLLARRAGGTLLIERRRQPPEETVLRENAAVLFGDWTVRLGGGPESGGGTVRLQLKKETMTQPLRITRWRTSDCLKLPGARGARSLKRLCTDCRIPPPARDGLPVVRIGETPAAVPGIGVDVRFMPAPGEDAVQLLFQRESGYRGVIS